MSASFAGLAGRIMWRATMRGVRRGPQVVQGGTQDRYQCYSALAQLGPTQLSFQSSPDMRAEHLQQI